MGEIKKNGATFYPAVLEALDSQRAIIKFMHSKNANVTYLSYEKSLLFPENLIEAIAASLKVSFSPAQKKAMINFIKPERNTGNIRI
jgi:hypothetical protein